MTRSWRRPPTTRPGGRHPWSGVAGAGLCWVWTARWTWASTGPSSGRVAPTTRLAHGYAITAHRSQGSTVDVAHVLDDGGGRELAYVAMSRARTASHIYVTALDPDHAAQRLTWGWDQQRRQEWITHRHHLAARTTELVAERDRLAASIPPDVTDQLARLRHQIVCIEADRADLQAGTGRWADTPVRHVHQALHDARRTHDYDLVRSHDPYLGLWARHRGRRAEQTSAINLTQAETVWQEAIRPHDEQLRIQKDRLVSDARTLEAAHQTRTEFLAAHPDIVGRITQLDHVITEQQRLAVQAARPPIESTRADLQPRLGHDPNLECVHHQQIAEAIHAPRIGGPGI